MTQKLVEMSILLLFWYICRISKSTAFEEITDLAVNPKIPVTSPVDVAATDFITLVSNSHIFADKTLLINDILKSPHKAILITCPPRWGKTTNLHMLEHFLEVEVDQKGRKITPKTEAPNYKLFRNGVLKDGTKLHKPLLISKYNDLFNKFQGKYPVLYIDFSFHNIPITTLEKFQEEMRRKISTAYEHHRYMLAALKATMNSTTVTDEEKFIAIEEHEKFLVYLECRAPLDDIYGLDFLSDILSRHFKRKVFLLIDEYDHLVNHLLLESTSHDSEKIMEHYLNFLMYSIRDSEAVSKSIVTGVMTAAKNVSKFGLNNLVDHDFINGPLSHYHGYTPTEIDLINEHFKITPETRATIDSWLNGFNINTTTLFKVINPWSMNHYLKTKEFVHHDGNLTSSEPILKELLKIPEFEEAWCALLSGSNYTISVTSLKFTPKDLKGLRSMVANAKYYEDYYLRPDAVSTDIALHYLLVNGYLTLSEYQYKPPHITNISLTLTLPNHEYADKFAKYMITYYTERRIGLNPLTLDKYARDIGSSFHKLLIGKADCLPVQNILHQFLQALPLTIHIASENDTIHLRFNKNLIRSSLLFVFSRTESFHIHNSHLQRKGRRPDIILTQGSNAGALYIQYGNQPEPIGTLNHTLHTKVFRENYYFRHINTLKLVAIYVAHNKTVSVQTCNKEIGKRVKANNPANSDTMASITLAAKANG